MNQDQAAMLRAPFPPEKVGKLPRVTCGKCRDSRERSCDSHKKSKCSDCGNWITSAHIHLDFVGHADATDRFLEVDPDWHWEPFALDPRGLPAFDDNGGMWIRLTIAGTTRIGYGDADGKKGANAVKEAIGDALRNAGLRFGVALDLWRKEGVVEQSTPRSTGWDPETQLLVDAFLDEIRLANDDDDIAAVGKSIASAKNKGELPKSAYERLARAGAARKAELNGAAKT
jgi:hypothetical protein